MLSHSTPRKQAATPMGRRRVRSNDRVAPSHIFTQYVGCLTIEPAGREQMVLGEYGNRAPAKGFLICLDQATGSADAAAIETISQVLTHGYRLVLDVMNHGEATLTVEVWRM